MLMKICSSLLNAISQLYKTRFPDPCTQSFLAHNSKIWKGQMPQQEDGGEIIFEYSEAQTGIIAYSYLAHVLAHKHNAVVKPYMFAAKYSKFHDFYYFLFKKCERLYRSFGTKEMLVVKVTESHKRKAAEFMKNLGPSLKTKRDIEQISINGVTYGDLIYDDYLRVTFQPTIDLDALDFKKHIEGFISLVFYWEEYFDTHNVKAVHVSHCVYKQAIISRLAIAKDIPNYQVNASHVYRMNAKNQTAYNESLNFPETFQSLSEDVQKKGIDQAKERLQRRLSGEVAVDMRYSTRSAFGESKHENLLEQNNRKKILIATHCFFDSPHPYGINLFPDFYEWITCLGEISERTDYDWYIKTHPDFLPGNAEVIDYFLEKYKRFKLLPADASHHQIIAEGIDVALTVHGTIGIEYATLGIPVINASQFNPHIRYGFNAHPETVEKYVECLENLDSFKLPIDENEIYEYYFMKHLYYSNDWLFDDYKQMEQEMGGYRGQFSSKSYDYFLDQFTQKKHQEIIKALDVFVESGEFRMTPAHFQN